MTKGKEKARRVLEILEKKYPDAHIHLNYETPLQLLLATVLAAQCTDARVNEVTPALWEAFPTAADIASAGQDELHKILRPTGFFRRKTKSVRAICRAIAEKHNGRVPESLQPLTDLPGVGRKTANVVLSNAFGKEAIAVDTHVQRVSTRLGLAACGHPDRIEERLCELIPVDQRSRATLLLGEHGRQTCKSRKPACNECPVNKLCDYLMKYAG